MTHDNSAGVVGLSGQRGTIVRPQWTVWVLAVVVLADQATKWWAWRHVAHVHINFGGDPLVPATVDTWYADPTVGAVLDLVGAGVLGVAVAALLRRHHPPTLRATAALAIGGWASNLLDRLGLHRLTAPGSVRGAVDFIHIGRYYYNIADFFIVGATLVFVVAHVRRSTTSMRPGTKPKTSSTRPRSPARIAAATGAAAALVTVVTLGATHYGGTTVPLTSSESRGHDPDAPSHARNEP
jgi:lipoprotein signal peptidase